MVGGRVYEPQAMALPDRPRYRAVAVGRAGVADLAVQGAGDDVEPEPPVSRAVTDGIGGQFVDGEHHVAGPVLGHAAGGRVAQHRLAQPGQCTGVELAGQRLASASFPGLTGCDRSSPPWYACPAYTRGSRYPGPAGATHLVRAGYLAITCARAVSRIRAYRDLT